MRRQRRQGDEEDDGHSDKNKKGTEEREAGEATAEQESTLVKGLSEFLTTSKGIC